MAHLMEICGARRCDPLVMRGTTARTAPDERIRKVGQMGHFQRTLVS
jgi:hypothetical protein